jgi:hypothetical protein
MSRFTLVLSALCTLVAVALTSPAHAVIATKTIYDLSGQSMLDGSVDAKGLSLNPTFVIGTPGSINSGAVPPLGTTLWHVSKFDLTGFTDLVGSAVNSATLTIPDQNTTRNGVPSAQDFIAEHFEAQSSTTIVAGDGTVAALTALGTVIPTGGTGNASSTSTVTVDVTAQVAADLAAGRTLSSYRIGHDPGGVPASLNPGGSNYSIDDSNGAGGGWGGFSDNLTRLTIDYTIPEPATATLLGLGALAMVRRKR